MRVLLAALTLLALTACDFGIPQPPGYEPPVKEARNPCKALTDEASCSANAMCESKVGQYGETKKCKPKAE